MRVVVLMLIAALAGRAMADPEVAPEALAKAKAHFDRGKASYEAGNYKTAIDEYLAAYALAPFPELVFNIGQAFRLAGKDARALEAYEMYLAQQPQGELAPEAQGHVLGYRNRGVSAAQELGAKRATGWSELDDKLRVDARANDEAREAAFHHRRQRYFVGAGGVSFADGSEVTGIGFNAVGGLYRRVTPRVAIQPRVTLGTFTWTHSNVEKATTNSTWLAATMRVLAYPLPWLYLGGGIGLAVSNCKDVTDASMGACDGGVFTTSAFEVGVLLGDRYEIGASIHPGVIADQSDVYDTGNVRAVVGLTFSYHL
jgi:hypothetical protein